MGKLIIVVCNSGFHFAFKAAQHGSYFTVKDVFDLLNAVVIVMLGLIVLTWPFAITQLVFQTNLKFAFINIFAGKLQVTGAQGISFLNKPQNIVHHAHRGIRAQVFGAIFNDTAGPENAGIILVLDDDPRVGFIILQHHIVAWLMLFDHAVLQQPGIYLGINNSKSDVAYFGYQNPGLGIDMHILIEVGSYTVAQIFGFTNIYQFLLTIPVLINTGFVRYIF